MAYVSKWDQVLLDGVAVARERGVWVEGDEGLVKLDALRFLNATRDAGRPSDAMRSCVRAYLSDPVAYRRKASA